MKIRGVSAKSVLNSRKERTISVSIKTNIGVFSASSPVGKSTGKYEAKSYRKSLEGDIETIKKFSEYFSEEIFDEFNDLRRAEDIVDRHIGANTMFALEAGILKAMAKEQKKKVWQIISPNAKKIPRLVGNCIGGGEHSHLRKKPDFQEFLLIPERLSVKKALESNKKAKKEAEYALRKEDKLFIGKRNDEDAWESSLNEKEVLEILKESQIPLGLDVAASGFYKRRKYHYNNPPLYRNKEEQFSYLSNLIKNFSLFYIEDPFGEEEFESFAELLKKFPNRLIVGDDLTVTKLERFKKAIKMKSVNAIIIKPNQTGSLIEVKDVVKLAKKNNIKTVFSHRSGETEEPILADLAFGFEADFFKCGITGREREAKLKRLIEIEESIK
jgi:enolase